MGFTWSTEEWRVALDLARVLQQDRVASFEETTNAYSNVDLRISRDFTVANNVLFGGDAQVFLVLKNATDAIQYEHASFVKEYTPGAARRVEIGLKYRF